MITFASMSDKMWNQPFGMREGFLIGGCLIAAGLMLQLGVGPIDWDALRWPVNGIMLAVFLVIITIIFLSRKKVHGFQFIGTYKAAVPALVYVVALTIIMGLTPQNSLTHGSIPKGEESSWINSMLNFWPFVLTYVYIAVILGHVVILRGKKLFQSYSPSSFLSSLSSFFNHFGLFLALTTAALGSADMQQLKMITVAGEPVRRAMNSENVIVDMPFTIELKEFVMETYDDGRPKRYASVVQIQTQAGEAIQTTIDVNKPVDVDGWKIYQYDYDTKMSPMGQTSILELVRDPWLPLVYTGIYMMIAGAVMMMLRSIPWRGGGRQARKHPKTALLLCAVIAACFFCVHHFMPILHSDTLVPALQSPWFKPHIIVYMLAYTLMASAAVIAIYQMVRGARREVRDTKWKTLDVLVIAGISLITIGMLFGALWAKEAWGHYWSWDPKETWAAITWFAYLVYVHYRQIPTHQPKLALWVVIVSFLLLQMCWWGINYLPSIQGSSVHVYGMTS